MKINKINRFFIYVAFLMITPVWATSQSSCPFYADCKVYADCNNMPADYFVRRFFGWVLFKNDISIEDLKAIRDCFEQKLYKNLMLKMSIHGKGEIAEHEFNYNPLLLSQEAPPGFRILNNTSANPSFTHVSVDLPDLAPSLRTIDLTNTKGKWKIANIKSDLIDLKKEVDEAAAYLKAQKKEK